MTYHHDLKFRLPPEHYLPHAADFREEFIYRDDRMSTNTYTEQAAGRERLRSMAAIIDPETGLFDLVLYRQRRYVVGVLEMCGLRRVFGEARDGVKYEETVASGVTFAAAMTALEKFESEAKAAGLKQFEGPLRTHLHFSFLEAVLKDGEPVIERESAAVNYRTAPACDCPCKAGRKPVL